MYQTREFSLTNIYRRGNQHICVGVFRRRVSRLSRRRHWFHRYQLAFGISVVAMAYSIGSISGAHLNPAVSIGAFVAGRISVTDLIGYTVSQTIGAIIAAGMILVIATNSIGGHDVAVSGLGQNGWGAGYDGEFFMISAFIFEVVATAVFLVVILGVMSDKGTPMMAGLVIGLTLVMIHLVGISVTGTSVKPARSIGPALFVGALHCRSFGCSLLPH